MQAFMHRLRSGLPLFEIPPCDAGPGPGSWAQTTALVTGTWPPHTVEILSSWVVPI